MTNEELNTALYKKCFAEQEKYRDWLLHQTPEEILHHTYEYTMREDILLSLEYNDLSDKECEAMLQSPAPIAEVFHDLERQETGHMENVWDIIQSRAHARMRENFLRSQEEAR